MKHLILYMSHHGTTGKIALELAEMLGKNDTLVINAAEDSIPGVALFDTVIIGGSIHMGQIQKKVRTFCSEHREELMKKKLGLFLCFMNKEQSQKEFEGAFPLELRQHAAALGLFGGELLFDKMSFIEKMVTKKISGLKENTSMIDENAVKTFAKEILQDKQRDK